MNTMITEIEVAQKLSLVKDVSSDENIVNSGRVQGINIYKEKINILIAKINNESENDILNVKKNIKNALSQINDISIDVKEGELKKSDITHLLNMSKVDKNDKKVNDKWNMDSHKLFWHLDRVEAWQRGERVAPLHIDMGISSGCNMACTFCYGVIQNRDGFGTNSKNISYTQRSSKKNF